MDVVRQGMSRTDSHFSEATHFFSSRSSNTSYKKQHHTKNVTMVKQYKTPPYFVTEVVSSEDPINISHLHKLSGKNFREEM